MEQKLTRVRDRQKQNIKSGLIYCIVFSMVLIVGACCLLLLEYLSSGNIPDGVGVLSSYRHEATIQDGIIYNKYYDKDNHLVKWFHTDLNGTLVDVDHDGWVYHSAVSEYEDGKEISWTTYSYEGSICQVYDKNGNCLMYVSLDTEGAPRIDPDWGYYKMESAYFPDTNIEEKSKYYTLDRIEEYTYNKSSELVQEAYYDLDMNPISNPYQEPDETHGNDEEIYELSDNNTAFSFSQCDHKYNENGDMIEHIGYNEDGSIECVSKYNESGSLIEHIQYDTDGSVWCVKKYNDNGELIEHTGHGSISSNQAIDYDPAEDTYTDTQTQHKVVYITSASVNLRSGPGTEYSIVVNAKNGNVLDYAGLTEVDTRGNEWHSVIHPEKGMVWVSSKFSELQTTSDN